jgi:hypothetical protein
VKPENTAEGKRLREDLDRRKNWKRWGPYLSERQWGTVREDYSVDGSSWDYFPHDHARRRAYRWGEDGLLGVTDRQGRLCFALSLWNGKDKILKERLFGLTGSEGNHGEDVKECYFYLDSTPTHSYLKGLYKYPQAEFPYERLVEENRRRGKGEPELELLDTGVFADSRYFDVTADYAKASPNDLLIRILVVNRGPEPSRIVLLPTLWFRNTWSWGRTGQEGHWPRPGMEAAGSGLVTTDHPSLGLFTFAVADKAAPLLFTENETNLESLFGVTNTTPFVKDAFHEYVIAGRTEKVHPSAGTKVAALCDRMLEPGATLSLRLRLYSEKESPAEPFGAGFDEVFARRRAEADEYYDALIPPDVEEERRSVMRQGYAGLLWSKQFYHFSVRQWLEGDPTQPTPPVDRTRGRNHEWSHLYNRDVVSMPDKWEYPWYAAWDLAFHMIPFASLDPDFAKEQLVLLLREWYMHPNGQLPAYEWAFSDVNPPVHAWAAWRVYKMSSPRGERDLKFLARVFHKLLLNFTWWVNRKDPHGDNIFSGGFLGLDNIGVFDRSQQLPTGGHLEQADGTAWMAFFCMTMLSMALELARHDPAYEDVASKFFEHLMAIVDAINKLDGQGLWDEEDGFYYDHLHVDGRFVPLKVRSLVGLLPMIAVEILDDSVIAALPGFRKRMNWFLENRRDIIQPMACMERGGRKGRCLLAIASEDRLRRLLARMLDEREFLSPYGVRSLSKTHLSNPYVFTAAGSRYSVRYTPGESDSHLFGGNSNWRGPVWFPTNYLLVEALERYDHFYGDVFQVEFPTGSGNLMDLGQIARELSRRLVSIFLPQGETGRPCHAGERLFAEDPHWRDLVLFYEYFHGDTGRGVGAGHQTGWTALVVKLIEGLVAE